MLTISYLLTRGVLACEPSSKTVDATPEQIKAFFANKQMTVLTFTGYSGAGYEDDAAMLAHGESMLGQFDPSKTIVNIGATAEGIGALYELAKRKGFSTTGIVSTQARDYNVALSPCVDLVFFVSDSTWGGFVDGTDRLSPTSAAMVESSDVIVGIGGGEISRDEMIAAKRAGKDVRFIAADMNHQVAREKAQKKGLEIPTDFSGAAAAVF